MKYIKSRQPQPVRRDIIWIKTSLWDRDLKNLKQRPQQKQGDQCDQHPLSPGPAKGQKEQHACDKIPRNMQPKPRPESLCGTYRAYGRVIDQRDKRDGEEPEEEKDFCKQNKIEFKDCEFRNYFL